MLKAHRKQEKKYHCNFRNNGAPKPESQEKSLQHLHKSPFTKETITGNVQLLTYVVTESEEHMTKISQVIKKKK